MNKEEIDVWLKHFANRPVGYQMYDENQVRKEFNLFNVFQYLKILQIENNQLKDECYKKRNDNKSLRGTLKATLETSNNRHQEIKRLLEKIEKLDLNHKQLKDLDKTQKAISKLLKEKEDLKKWLRVCLDEEEQKTLSSISSGYEMGIITTLRSVIAKIEDLGSESNE